MPFSFLYVLFVLWKSIFKNLPGAVAHVFNPSILGGQSGWITWGQEFKTSLANMVSTKNTKISWAWWCVPVVPATREAEAGELLEPRRRRLWWAEIVPLHSSLGNKSETPSQNTHTPLHKWHFYNIRDTSVFTHSIKEERTEALKASVICPKSHGSGGGIQISCLLSLLLSWKGGI